MTVDNLDAHEIAVAVASHDRALGSIVIILTADGDLDIALVTDQNDDVSAALLGIQGAIKEHCDSRHRELVVDGVPAGEN
jgi:hypothetical protein